MLGQKDVRRIPCVHNAVSVETPLGPYKIHFDAIGNVCRKQEEEEEEGEGGLEHCCVWGRVVVVSVENNK